MKSHSLARTGTGFALVAALLMGSAPAATATTESSDDVLGGTTSQLSITYSDMEIAELLFAGTGPIAEDNPEIVKRLNFDPSFEAPPREDLLEFVKLYLSYHDTFNEEVAQPLSSGNPQVVEEALQTFGLTYMAFLEEELEIDVSNPVGPQCDGTACGVTMQVVAAAAYATVAVATFALGVVVVVPGVVTYLMEGEGEGTTELERRELVAQLTESLAR